MANHDGGGGAHVFSRRRLLGGAVAGGAALGLSWALEACGASGGGGGTGAGSTPHKGGKLIWATESDPVNLAPFGMGNTSNAVVNSLIYDSLVRFDRKLLIQPGLAESWSFPDNLTCVFKLRKGVTFHSGKPFEAEDVVYSLKLQASPPPPGTVTAFYPKIGNVEAVDASTVKITLTEPDASLLGYFAWNTYSHIVPKGFYEQTDVRQHADGTGPFKLVEYVPNDHVTLAANRKYWRGGFPYVDQLTLKVLADEQARVAGIRSGAIDGSNVTADTARTLANDSTLRVLKGLTGAQREIEFTIKPERKPWNDVRVRQAINFAIDRNEIIEKVYGGDAAYSGKIPPGYGTWPLNDKQLRSKYEKHDLNAAKRLMQEAGVASGFPVQLQSISSPADYTQIAQVLKAQLAKININVSVQPLEIATFATNNSSGKFEWQSTGRGMRADPSGFFSDFDPARSTYKAWYNGGYDSAQLMGLVKQAQALTDDAKRHQIYTQVQQLVLEQLPVMPVVNPMYYQVVRARVHGMFVSYDAMLPGLAETWVD
jgi:peptide/nickel transport system substrate-binding protein